MKVIIDVVSALTAKNQTTIPTPVRKALNLGKQDKIRFLILEDGKVILEKAEMEVDVMIEKLLNMLEEAINGNPGSVTPVSNERYEKLHQLAEGKNNCMKDKVIK